jgi:hypothetical protein
MKKRVPLLGNLLLSSMLFGAMPSAGAEELLFSVPPDTTEYCDLKFPAILESNLLWEWPVHDLSAGHRIDFYGPCDYESLGVNEIRVQRRALLRAGFDDGD